MPRAKEARALPRSKGSITSFFNGTAKALQRLVECPVCAVKVEEGQINKHMDGPDCKLEGSDIEIIEVEGKVKKGKHPTATQTKIIEDKDAEKEQNTCVGKPVNTEDPIPKLVGKRSCGPELDLKKPKRQKTLSEEVSSCHTERSTARDEEVLQQEVKDDSIISDLLEDEDWVDEDAHTASQHKILLSPSISYNPARYILITSEN